MAVNPLILNGHPVIIQLGVDTEANIKTVYESGNTIGRQGEIAFSSDSKKIFVFPADGGTPVSFESGELVCYENDVLCWENEALYY